MKSETKKTIRRSGVILFLIYVACLVYFLFFSEEYGRVTESGAVYHYNLVPFLEIRRFWTYRELLGNFAFLTNILGNVMGFFPFGFILPIILPKMSNGVLIGLAGFALSLGVEMIQLITRVGCFDVDDLILNTIGALAGFLGFSICNYIRRRIYGKKI